MASQENILKSIERKIALLSQVKMSPEEFQKAFTQDELDLFDEIEKGGKPATAGEIHEWNGKKYKKQPNGKWLEVSESHGMTGREHQMKFVADEQKKPMSFKELYEHEHFKEFKNLSDKEHSDEEVGLGIGGNGRISLTPSMKSRYDQNFPKGKEMTQERYEKALLTIKELESQYKSDPNNSGLAENIAMHYGRIDGYKNK